MVSPRIPSRSPERGASNPFPPSPLMPRQPASIYLYQGDMFDVLPYLVRAGLDLQSIFTDPPYSDVTCDGHNKGASGVEGRGVIEYSSCGAEEARRFCREIAVLAHGWVGVLTDDILAAVFREYLKKPVADGGAGRYSFAPVPCVVPASRVRFQGDGPPCESHYLVVGRPKQDRFVGGWSPRGYYIGHREEPLKVLGGKPLSLMVPIVRDYYSRGAGGFVCDPCLGNGQTCIACSISGIPSVGIEMSEENLDLAYRRCLEHGLPVTLVT